MTAFSNSAFPLRAAAACGFLGVAAGAFGAHGLATRVVPADLAIWETAADYQLWHAVALLALAALPASPARRRAAICWVAGTIIFSGSLYALVLTGIRRLGMITPIGGLLLLAGWAMLFCAVTPSPSTKEVPS